MTKQVIGFLFCIFTSGVVFAQDMTATAELKHALSKIEHVSTQFKQTVFDQQDVVFEATGKLYLARPGKVRWETEFPDEALMIADGESIWNIDSFVEQVTVLDQASAIDNNPIVLLTSQDDKAWRQFAISKLDNLDDLGFSGVTHGFFVESLQEAPQIQALSLYFNGDEIIGMSTLDAQGQLSQLAFSQMVVAEPIDASLFEANIPDSYSIDDQR